MEKIKYHKRETSCMIPAKGGASPEAMLLVSMPTGFFSMKLLYMVQAEFEHKHNKFTGEANTAGDAFTPLLC